MKQLIQNITTSISLPRALVRRLVLLLAALLVGVGHAWGSYKATVNVYSSPSSGGFVYVGTNSNCGIYSCTKNSHVTSQEKKGFSTSGSFTFYLCNKPATNYVFRGWSTSSSSNSGDGVDDNPWSASFSGSTSGLGLGGTTHNRYAIFACMTANVSSWNAGNVNVESSATPKSITITHAHADNIQVYLKKNTEGFGIVNSSGNAISQNQVIVNSVSAGTVSIKVSFSPQGAGQKRDTLVIHSQYSKLSDVEIPLSGTGVKLNQELTWDDPVVPNEYLLKDATRSCTATASTGLSVKYSSDKPAILSIDENSGLLTANAVGTEVTITATQAGNYKYNSASITRKFDVKSKLVPEFTPNPTPDTSPNIYNVKVDDNIVFSLTNVSPIADGHFTFTATKDNYGNDIVSFSRVGDVLTVRAIHEGTTTLTLNQAETYASPYIFSKSATYIIKVTKYDNNLSITVPDSCYVGESKTVTFNGKNSDADIQVLIKGVINSSQHNPNATYQDSVISYANGQITAWNKGFATITFIQPENNKFKGFSKTVSVDVDKYSNSISTKFDNVNATSKTIHLAESTILSISSTNKNNTNYQVALTSSDASIVSYTGTGASGTFASNYKEGNTTWSVTQAEDYKYQAGSATVSVNVSKMNEGVCYLLEDDDEKTLYWMVSNSYTYSWPDEVLPVAGKLTFEALRVGATESITPGQLVNNSWENLSDVGSSLTTSFKPFERDLNPSAKSVRFTSSGGVSKHIKNIKVSRLTFLRTTESSLNFGTTLEGNQVERQFYVEWSSSNTGDIHLSCDNSHFTVSPSIISNTDCASGRTLVTVTYLADEHPTTTDITHSGTITIYDKGRTTTPVNVTGTTQPQYNLVVSGQNRSITVEDDLNLSDIITYRYEGNSVVPAVPTYGENTSPFYFTIGIDNITSNQNDCAVPNAVVTYDPGTKKFHACNAGTVTITFTQVEDNGTPAVHAGMKVGDVHRDTVSYTITVTKHYPTFTWTLPNAEWASKYKFSNYFSSSNTATSWSAVSNTPIAEYKSATDSIYTNYRSGDATFTVTQEENYYWNRKDSTVTTNVQHGEEAVCYLYQSSDPSEDIPVWQDYEQVVWTDTAVAGTLFFDAKRGSLDAGTEDLYIKQFYGDGSNNLAETLTSQTHDFRPFEVTLDPNAVGFTFVTETPEIVGKIFDYTNHVKNVRLTRLPWVKASAKNVTLPTIGKQGYSEATVIVSWSGVEPLRIEKKNGNPHFDVSPDAYFVQTPCKSGSSVLTFAYRSDEAVVDETETFVIYDHAKSVEIIVHGTTENKDMQEIVWNQSFNPILAENGTINADSILTAYAVNRQGVRTGLPITYTVENTNIAEIDENTSNLLHITHTGRTTITATVAGNAQYGTASKTLVLNVLDGNGCGSYAFSKTSGVSLFTITSDQVMAVTRPAEDLYFEARRDKIAVLNPAAQHVKMRYKVADDNKWYTQDEYGVEIETGALSSDWGYYGPFRLPKNTACIQFYTELGAYFSQHVQNVYITQRSYLLKDTDELTATIVVNNTTEIGVFNVEYSDKPTLIINNKCSNVELHVDNPAPNMCGDAGKYTYTVTCLSDTIGVIKDTVTITSHLEGDTLLIPITITVCPDGHFYFDNGIDNNPAHTDWQVPEYWRRDNQHNHGTIPTKSSLTTIEGPVVIEGNAYAYQVTITGNGKVTVAPSGSLTVGAGGIIGANVSNLILEADNTGQTGILRLYPGIADEKIPDALVQIYTTAYWDRENGKKAVWQYIGTPVRNPDTNEHIFYQCWLYQYSPSADKWTNAGNWGHMTPFLAYAFTRDSKSSGPLTGFGGQLNTLAVQKKDMTYYDKDHCEYHFANSWTAPINLKGFKPSDFHNLYPVIYCYTMEGKGLAREIAAFSAEYTGEDVLPAMQGFFVRAKSNDEACYLTLDYERLVWSSATVTNKPLRAPSRDKEDELGLSARMCIQMTSADMVTDRIYLLEKDAEGFSSDYEIGYDAPKYFVDGLPCIYTYETSGPHLAVSATDDVVGTYLAINTNASQNYTLTFSKVIGEGLGLRDLVTNTIVPITEGMQYSFTAPANSSPMLRFVVVEHEETPEWNNNNGGTSLEDVGGEFKIWQSGEILSVIGAGLHANLHLYDAAGKLILSEFFNEATAISLTALPTGVYMVQVNDKTEKVLR